MNVRETTVGMRTSWAATARSQVPLMRRPSISLSLTMSGSRISVGFCSRMSELRRQVGAGATLATRIVRSRLARASKSSRRRRSSARMRRAWSRASRPAALMLIELRVRSKSGWPRSSSRRLSERERADCERCKRSAAACRVPVRAMTSSCLSCSSSIVPPSDCV